MKILSTPYPAVASWEYFIVCSHDWLSQFHPESIFSTNWNVLLRNPIMQCSRTSRIEHFIVRARRCFAEIGQSDCIIKLMQTYILYIILFGAKCASSMGGFSGDVLSSYSWRQMRAHCSAPDIQRLEYYYIEFMYNQFNCPQDLLWQLSWHIELTTPTAG